MMLYVLVEIITQDLWECTMNMGHLAVITGNCILKSFRRRLLNRDTTIG